MEAIVVGNLATTPGCKFDESSTLLWAVESEEALTALVLEILREGDLHTQARALVASIELMAESENRDNCLELAKNLQKNTEGIARHEYLTNMKLGQALEALEEGHHVARAAWSGTPQRLFMNSTSTDRVFARLPGDPGEAYEVPKFVSMITHDGKLLPGWSASQDDMFAKDFYIIK